MKMLLRGWDENARRRRGGGHVVKSPQSPWGRLELPPGLVHLSTTLHLWGRRLLHAAHANAPAWTSTASNARSPA